MNLAIAVGRVSRAKTEIRGKGKAIFDNATTMMGGLRELVIVASSVTLRDDRKIHLADQPS